mgnify:FL=1
MFGSIAQTARDTDYVFTVDTTIEGGTTSAIEFQFYTTNNVVSTGSIFYQEINNPDVNGVFNWNSAVDTNSPTINFPQEGIYRLRVPTNVTWGRPYHTSNVYYNDKVKITEINNWGNHVMYAGLDQSFYGCNNLDIVCQDTPNFPSTHRLYQTFVSCLNLEDLSGSIANWDVSDCNNLQSTFYNSQQFNTDVSKWDTSKSVTLYRTFGITQFNYPIDTHEVINYGRTYNAWNVSNVTRLYYTFGGYSVAGYPIPPFNQNLNNWDTSKVYDFRGTFYKCASFNQDINDWDTGQGQYFNNMFERASIFNQDISNWDTSEALQLSSMFLLALDFNQDISNWDTSKTTTMASMFYLAESFNANISNWDVSKVTTFQSMLRKAYVFDQDLSDWDTGQGITFTLMFSDASSFNANLQSWDTSNATAMTQMFWNAVATSSFTNTNQPLTSSYYNKHGREYLSWDTRNVYAFNYMFASDSNARPNPFNQDITNWDTSAATTFHSTFKANHTFNQDITTHQVTAGAGTSLERTYNAWDVSSVVSFTNTFLHAYVFNQPIGNWQINTDSSVTMTGMFQNADTFNQEISQSMVTVGSETYKAWDVSEVTAMNAMFYLHNNFSKDISNWNVKNVISFSQMFHTTGVFNQDLSKWDTKSATNMYQMFYNSYFNNAGQSLTSSYYNPSDRDAYIAWDTRNVANFAYTFASNKASFNQDISNWDTSAGTNFGLMFYTNTTGIFNQDISTKQVTVGLGTSLERTYNAWNVSKGISFGQMFQQQVLFNQPIGNWQLNTGSSVNINMQYLLYNAYAFNQDLNTSIATIGSGESSTTHLAWDTQRVSTFRRTLRGAGIFNKPIYKWDTSNNSSLELTFAYASDFNQDVSSSLQTHLITGQPYIAWDVEKVTTFTQTFISAGSFNKSIQNWNTVSGSSFSTMFQTNGGYNQSLARQNVTINGKSWTSWDVSNSTSGSTTENHGANLLNMFNSTSTYDGAGLSTWNIESASFNDYFLRSSNNVSTANYNDILSEWASQNPTYSGSINFGNAQYDGSVGSTPSASRSQLETVNGWVITDGGPV